MVILYDLVDYLLFFYWLLLFEVTLTLRISVELLQLLGFFIFIFSFLKEVIYHVLFFVTRVLARVRHLL